MRLGYELTIEQTQKLSMTPELIQAIQILQFNNQELSDYIQNELLENPVLEAEKSDGNDEIDIREKIAESEYELDTYRQWEGSGDDDDNDYTYEQYVSFKYTLIDYLLGQLQFSSLKGRCAEIGRYMIEAIDDNGYLTMSVEEIAETMNATAEEVEKVLDVIQTFDPVGVAARDAKECLLAQIYDRGLDKDPVLVGIVSEYLEDFEAKRFKPVMRRFRLDEEDLKEYLLMIQSLDPMPGASFGSSEPTYISPDVYVRKVGEDFVIVLNDDNLPQLTLSETFETSIQGTPEEKNFCAEKKRAANWLIRSLEQRNRTLYKVMESIVQHQREFFETGPTALKPLILREIAEDIGMHESTVSRITSNKYVATPHGLFELKYFFNSGVSRSDGSQLASESVKNMIKKLIAEEDKSSPLPDENIAEILYRELGVKISRRTVAKYRSVMDIPTSSRRKKSIL